jgi:hypothetical protein
MANSLRGDRRQQVSSSTGALSPSRVGFSKRSDDEMSDLALRGELDFGVTGDAAIKKLAVNGHSE